MNIRRLKRLAVDRYPKSRLRRISFDNLNNIIKRLNHFELQGEVWVDGSFMTQKPNPDDIDAVLRIRADAVPTPCAHNFINQLLQFGERQQKCHFQPLHEFPKSVATHYPFSLRERRRLMRLFGTFDNNKTPKGIAVIQLAKGVPPKWN